MRAFARTISLNVSAILPSRPTLSGASRTLKSPSRTACSAPSSSLSSGCGAPATVSRFSSARLDASVLMRPPAATGQRGTGRSAIRLNGGPRDEKRRTADSRRLGGGTRSRKNFVVRCHGVSTSRIARERCMSCSLARLAPPPARPSCSPGFTRPIGVGARRVLVAEDNVDAAPPEPPLYWPPWRCDAGRARDPVCPLRRRSS